MPVVLMGTISQSLFTVADIAFEAILGLPWLRGVGAVIDCRSGTLSFPSQLRSLSSLPAVHESWCSVVSGDVLSFEDSDTCYLLSVEAVGGSIDDPALKSLVSEYADIFPASLPLQLPP